MTLLPGLIYAITLVMAVAVAVTLRRWVHTRLQAAQLRLACEAWQEIRASRVPGEPGWPASQTGTRYFFGTDYVSYDPAADAAVYIEGLTRNVQAYIASFSRRACDDRLDVAGSG